MQGGGKFEATEIWTRLEGNAARLNMYSRIHHNDEVPPLDVS